MPNNKEMSLPPQMLRAQISEAKKRLAHLIGDDQRINQEMTDLRELIRANANLLPTGERELELLCLDFFKSPENITEAVRLAIFLQTVGGQRASPTSIKGFAEYLGFDFSEYSNPMASVHSILKRMRESAPPTVDYDEKTDEYWYGEVTLASAGDLLNPKAIEDTYTEAVKILFANVPADTVTMERIKDAARSSIRQKLEAIGGRKSKS